MAYTFKHGDRPVEGYTIQRAVGRGGFGEVYYSLSDGGREVAIKYLRDNPQVELRGVANCINLKSPHLVAIFDVKKTVDDEYAIIMEYCSGPSLRDLLIAEPRGFEPQKAAFFVREIAKGLTYLHDRGIVHRDLKPGNIFYDDGYVKIGDYGLSKFIAVSRHSGQTASVGTVHYMAPEIGSGNYSKGVDIYALGVMLYEMLLGKVPFEGSSLAEVLMKHLTTRPEIDDLPHPFGQVIRKALEKDPKDRYQTVDEMVGDLLDVEEVRESLAGFRPQSLQQAVRRGTPEGLDSPQPSPNPPPAWAPPPFAQPVRPGEAPGPLRGAVPDHLAKKMNRIARKMDAKLAKLGGRPAAQRTPGSDGGAATDSGAPSIDHGFPIADRKKRMLLSGLLSVGLAVGLGVLVGARTNIEEAGIAAGLFVFMMSGGIIGSRGAVRWFGVQHGPAWTQHLIRLCCCAPLLAIGAAPLFDLRRHADDGLAVWLGLLAISVVLNWENTFERSASGEMSFKSAIGTAFWALCITGAIGAPITQGDPRMAMFLAAGVAGAVSLIIQATSWWLPAKAASAMGRFASSDGAQAQLSGPMANRVDQPGYAALPVPPGPAYRKPVGGGSGAVAGAPNAATLVTPFQPEHPRVRWAVTRAFWGLVAFGLMGGAIVTFVLSLVAEEMRHHDKTAVVIACTGLASFMIFALRKTTPLKRDGFWRETLRPFLISASMAGIGGTITGIAREWSHRDNLFESGQCVGDEARAALITGLVMCSMLFLFLTLFTGRRRRTPQPFLQPSDSAHADALAANAGEGA